MAARSYSPVRLDDSRVVLAGSPVHKVVQAVPSQETMADSKAAVAVVAGSKVVAVAEP